MLVSRFVSETTGVNGGYPVVAGTRIPIWVLLDYHAQLGGVDPILQLFSYLSHEQVQGALDYYAACPERIDEDRARNKETWLQHSGQPWPA